VNYARFTALRRPACEDFERRLAAAQRRASSIDYDDLEELAFQYRQLLHDHALAAARFPGTAIARRLHALVLRATHWLQRDPGDHLPSPVRFVNQTFPRAFRKQRSLIALSAVLFALGGLVGVCLTAAEPAIASVFLGPDAIDGLREGRIWTESIFAVTPGSVASTRIATNNMAVAMTGWAGGALAGLFGIYVLVLNGLMLGAVVTVTMHYSMAPRPPPALRSDERSSSPVTGRAPSGCARRAADRSSCCSDACHGSCSPASSRASSARPLTSRPAPRRCSACCSGARS